MSRVHRIGLHNSAHRELGGRRPPAALRFGLASLARFLGCSSAAGSPSPPAPPSSSCCCSCSPSAASSSSSSSVSPPAASLPRVLLARVVCESNTLMLTSHSPGHPLCLSKWTMAGCRLRHPWKQSVPENPRVQKPCSRATRESHRQGRRDDQRQRLLCLVVLRPKQQHAEAPA